MNIYEKEFRDGFSSFYVFEGIYLRSFFLGLCVGGGLITILYVSRNILYNIVSKETIFFFPSIFHHAIDVIIITSFLFFLIHSIVNEDYNNKYIEFLESKIESG